LDKAISAGPPADCEGVGPEREVDLAGKRVVPGMLLVRISHQIAGIIASAHTGQKTADSLIRSPSPGRGCFALMTPDPRADGCHMPQADPSAGCDAPTG